MTMMGLVFRLTSLNAQGCDDPTHQSSCGRTKFGKDVEGNPLTKASYLKLFHAIAL